MNYRVLGGAILSTAMAGGIFYYFNFVYRKKNILEKDDHDDEDYECKYYDQYLDLSNNTLSSMYDNNNELKIVKESTPSGDIIMHYDTSLDYYKYYINDKNIPYKYLETVSRKFCIDHDCKGHYIDLFEEIELSKKKILQEHFSIKNKVKTEVNRVFATFKKYNNNNENQTKKQYVVPDKSNRYKYMGKYQEFLTEKEKKEKEENDKSSNGLKLSYKDFMIKVNEPDNEADNEPDNEPDNDEVLSDPINDSVNETINYILNSFSSSKSLSNDDKNEDDDKSTLSDLVDDIYNSSSVSED